MQEIIDTYLSSYAFVALFIAPCVAIIALIAVCFMQARDNNILKAEIRRLEDERRISKLAGHEYVLTPERRAELIKHMQELEERDKQRGLKPGQLTYKK